MNFIMAVILLSSCFLLLLICVINLIIAILTKYKLMIIYWKNYKKFNLIPKRSIVNYDKWYWLSFEIYFNGAGTSVELKRFYRI